MKVLYAEFIDEYFDASGQYYCDQMKQYDSSPDISQLKRFSTNATRLAADRDVGGGFSGPAGGLRNPNLFPGWSSGA